MTKEEKERSDFVDGILKDIGKMAESKWISSTDELPYSKEIWTNGFIHGYLQSEKNNKHRINN